MQENVRENVTEEVRELIRERLDLHVHFDGPITFNVNVSYPPAPTPPPVTGAVKAILSIGANMPGVINVDTTNENVVISWVDDKQNAAAAPANAVATFTSSDDTIATIAPDASNPLVGDVTPLAPGTVTFSVAFNGTAMEADGVTPIPDPDATAPVEVDPGAAAGARLSLTV